MKTMRNNKQAEKGFTIVELLIVIVVIGILAAITIVAYNGVQSRARAAAASNAASDAAKKVEVFAADGAGYPATLAAAGVTNGNTTYQYTVNNAVTPATYCLTATYTTASYMMSSTNNVPTAGACPGHGVGGVAAITNLVTNPSVETNAGSWGGTYGTGGAATAGRVATTGQSGSSFFRATLTAAPTSITANGFWVSADASVPAAAGKSYTATGYLRTSWAGGTFALNLVPYDASWSYPGGEVYGPAVTMPANTWTLLSVTMPSAPASTANMTLRLRATGGTLPNVNSTVDGDAMMLVEGTTAPNYADGNTANWIWNGTVNNSSSTGPPV